IKAKQMQKITLLGLIFISTASWLYGQEWAGREDWPDDFPRPEQTEKSLFFIQRNLNRHTIIYDLNLNEDGTLNRKEPIDNYWRQYESTGKRREMSWLEEWLAYGYRARKKSPDLYQVKLRAHKERFINLKKEGNQWKAVIDINGEESYLTNIYAYADESGILPDVKHVDIYGINIRTGKRVKERIYD
ncbi:MAG: DUF4833 domain-containing protein, partial [Bacteroidota bacterium]